MRRAMKIALYTVAAVAVSIGSAFLYLQTGSAKNWLARTLEAQFSGNGRSAAIGAMTGFIPFDIRVARIELRDRNGSWLAIDTASLAWSPTSLLGGTLRIDRLAADSVEMTRAPVPSGEGSPSGGSSLPHLPVAIELRALEVSRLALGPEIAGGRGASASVVARGLLARRRADLTVKLSRTDQQPGSAALEARYDESQNALDLSLGLDEPTGVLLDAALGRIDHLPLRITLAGNGPLSDWHGKLAVQAADAATMESDIGVAHAAGTRIALAGSAAIAALLPEQLRPVVGNAVQFKLAGSQDAKGGLRLEPSSVRLQALALDAEGARSERHVISGTAHIEIDDASAFQPVTGTQLQGSLTANATLAGTEDKPQLALNAHGRIALAQLSIEGLVVSTQVNADAPKGDGTRDLDILLDLSAQNLLETSDGGQAYGSVRVHAAGRGDTRLESLDIREATASGAGLALKGNGRMEAGVAQGRATLAVADLSVVGTALGRPLRGSSTVEIAASRSAGQGTAFRLTGAVEKLGTGTGILDALLAGTVKITGEGTREPGGRIGGIKLSIEGSRMALAGGGAFDPGTGTLAADARATLPDLQALGSTLQSPVGGSGSVTAKLGGTLDQLAMDLRIALDHVVYRSTRIDRLDATMSMPKGFSAGAAASAHVISGKLDETLDANVKQGPGQIYTLERLRAAGNGGAVDGTVAADIASRQVTGSLKADLPDLSLWTGVVGEPIAGRVAISLDLPAGRGRQGPVEAVASKLAVGVGSTTVESVTLSGRVSGDYGHPSGVLDLALSGLATAGASLADANAHLSANESQGNFNAHLAGRYRGPVALDLAGSYAIGGQETTLRLAKLDGSLRRSRIALTRQLTVAIAPQRYRMTGLAIDVDEGTLAGDATISPSRVSANLSIKQLPLRPFAALAGLRSVGGTADGSLAIGGTTRQPDARLSLATRNLDLQTDGPLPRPKLELTAAADWHGARANADLRLASGTGETLRLVGSVPLAFDLAAFQSRRSADPRLDLRLTGGGRVENLISIVPLGEDRVSGTFSANASIAGTIAAPQPHGEITVSGGRYANAALGTELDGIDLVVRGAGERFVLERMNASDGANGRLTASGSVNLGERPAPIDVRLGVSNFMVARSDEVTVNADGELKLTGTLTEMTLSGKIGVPHAELYLPDRLPANVITLDVIEIGGKPGGETEKPSPAAPVALQIALDAPGQLFVRGRGILSEWRGHVDVTGTTAAPIIIGQLQTVTGTADLLGQTFTFNRGVVGFNGGTHIDPVLDIQASATASGITAQLNVTGTAASPKLSLSSVPALPQDEILARVLFGQNVASLTPAEGLQLAQTAATLSQGGPGILDRVRSKIGLDRLDITGGGGNTSGTQGLAKGTTVSGGKYIANGVYVGAKQGASGKSSQAEVIIEVTPHITIDSTFGTSRGTGFGAKYTIDY